jgi:hypothetical protein
VPNKPYDKKLRGNKQCQCQACYEYFTTVSGFDRHRYGGWGERKCLTPSELSEDGWTFNANGFWRLPAPKSGIPLAMLLDAQNRRSRKTGVVL